jgi:2-polyprenyl-6-methoxyphenol hydroxylase-like FAD-dependent oxidoreductase
VVIGASIAGLTAAAAVAGQFDEVVIVERDRLPDAAEPRRGVPQGEHGHVLLVSGARALEELFPGLAGDLRDAGAVTLADLGTDMTFFRYGVRYRPMPLDLPLQSFTRPLLETVIRRRVNALSAVTIRDGTAVSGLAGDRHRVTGVRLEDDLLEVDLVVDASGRGSRSDRWLADLGHPAPGAVEVKIGVHYTTRLFTRTDGDFTDGRCVLVLPAPKTERRVGLAFPVEGDRWLISMGGWHNAGAPASADEFRAYARSLPYRPLSALVERAEPLTELATLRFPASRRRHFERLRHPAAGYVTVGDAVCSFNPVYGQGMTCAALEALALRSTVERHGPGSARLPVAFARAVARIVTTPWRFATGGDFAFPETTGPRPAGIDWLNKYTEKIQLAAQTSVPVRRAFINVQQLLAPPSVLFRPAMVAQVLRASRVVAPAG